MYHPPHEDKAKDAATDVNVESTKEEDTNTLEDESQDSARYITCGFIHERIQE
jgi:hypothetical protein